MCNLNFTVRRFICATLLRTLPEPVAWKVWLKVSALLPAIIATVLFMFATTFAQAQPDPIPDGYVLRVPQSPDMDHTAGPDGLCLAEYVAPDGEFVVLSVECATPGTIPPADPVQLISYTYTVPVNVYMPIIENNELGAVIATYWESVAEDGDCLNDWLTHMPQDVRQTEYGKCIDNQ